MAAQRQSPSAGDLLRRRSSVVYDPARDIFSEILEPVNEVAVENPLDSPDTSVMAPSKPSTASPVQLPTKLSSDPHKSPRPASSPTLERPRTPSSKVAPSGEPHLQAASSSPPKAKQMPPKESDVSKSSGKAESPIPEKASSEHKKSSPSQPKTVSELPRIKRKIREDGEIPDPKRIKSPPSAYSRRPDTMSRRRSPPPYRRSRSRSPYRRSSPSRSSTNYRRRDPSPSRRERSPSPIRASPPRDGVAQRPRPGGATGRTRNVLAEAQRIAAERERENAARAAQVQAARGVQDVSNQFYNTRPEWVKERGRDWRKNESKIKGLRSFNNWIKSCIIQKFSPEIVAAQEEELGWGEVAKEPEQRKPLLVLDIGCGKGGDLGKWQLAPQTVGLYVGLDPAAQSLAQARDRYEGMRRGRRPIYDGRFYVQDCFGEWIGNVPIIREVGIDPNVGPGAGGNSRWSGGGGFDVVSAMFTMHYAFETEERVRTMLRNVAGSLKKGGRFLGVVPNSDALAVRVVQWHSEHKAKKDDGADGDQNKTEKENGHATEQPPAVADDAEADAPNWGNSIYRVRFPADTDRPTAADGTFRPPFGWKYTYWMDEAVDVPEYVVPWEAFRALAEGFNLEQRYRKPFLDVWAAEKDDRDLAALSVRMGVRRYEGGPLEMSDDEKEAVSFYHAFCFVKV